MRFDDWYSDDAKYYERNDFYENSQKENTQKGNYGEYYPKHHYYSRPKPEPKRCCPCPKPEPKHCCYPCPKPVPCCYPCPKPQPKPPIVKTIVAQLINPDRQNLGTNDPFLFTSFDSVSVTNPAAPIYYTSGSITINKTGRFIITYNTVVRFDDTAPTDRVRLQLNRNGVLVPGSDTIVRDEIEGLSPTVHTVSRTTLVNVQAGDILQFICRRNNDAGSDFFRLTTLVIEQV